MNEEFKKWLTEKGISEAQFAEKNANEAANLFVEFNAEVQAKRDKLIEDKASKQDIIDLQKSIDKNREDQFKKLNAIVKEQGAEIVKLKKGETKKTAPSLLEALEAQKDSLVAEKNASKGDAGKVNFEVQMKAVGDMTIGGNVSGGNMPVEDRLPGVEMIPSRRIRILDLVSKGNTTSGIVSWVDQANQEGAAGGTGEGLSKNQIDFDLVVSNEAVKKRTAYIKVSTEMLDDIPFMETLIRTELMKELMKDIENQVYQGDGTGTNLNGMKTQATAWAAGVHALTVEQANVIDVLVVGDSQIRVAEHEGATAYLLHPSDVTQMRLTKRSATDGAYVDRLLQVGLNLFLDGVPIIETTLVTQDTFLVAQMDLDLLVERSTVTIDVGLDGNDFTKNMRTVLAEWRGLNIIKTNNLTAFVDGVISTSITALEKV